MAKSRQTTSLQSMRRLMLNESGRWDSWVYVLDCPNGPGGGGPRCIKIGHSVNVKARFLQIRRMHQVVMMGYVGAALEQEQMAHKTLRQWRVKSKKDYYHPTPEVLEFVNNLLETKNALGI